MALPPGAADEPTRDAARQPIEVDINRSLLGPAGCLGAVFAVTVVSVSRFAVRILGMMLKDIVLTRDEIKGLSRGLLVSNSEQPAPAPTRLTEWLDQHAGQLGVKYANEVSRHYG